MTNNEQQPKMKSAEEWSKEIAYIQGINMANQQFTMSDSATKWWIKEIQLDAFKAGARWAAGMCDRSEYSNGGIGTDIRSAAKNLKEIPE